MSFAWTAQHGGGLRHHVRDLAHHLSRWQHQVHVLCVNTDPLAACFQTRSWMEGPIQVQEFNYAYQDLRCLFDFQRIPQAEVILGEWAQRLQLQLIHIHHNLFIGMRAIPALAAYAPVLTSLHDYWPLDPRGQLFDPQAPGQPLSPNRWEELTAHTWPQEVQKSREAQAYYQSTTNGESALWDQWLAYSRRCLAASRRLVAPSPASAAIYAAHGFQQPIRVVENGIPTPQLQAGLTREPPLSAPSGPLKLALLGNITASKGQLAFCQACTQLSLWPRLQLHLHGQLPTNQAELLELSAAAPEQIHLRGAYQRRDLLAIFASSDLVVVPSLWEEVYGLVAREALSYGLPLIVSSAAGLASLGERSRVLVLNHRDPAHWPEQLEEAFCRGPLLQWIWERRQRQLPSDHQVRSSEACSLELLHLYQEVLAEGQSSSP